MFLSHNEDNVNNEAYHAANTKWTMNGLKWAKMTLWLNGKDCGNLIARLCCL